MQANGTLLACIQGNLSMYTKQKTAARIKNPEVTPLDIHARNRTMHVYQAAEAHIHADMHVDKWSEDFGRSP